MVRIPCATSSTRCGRSGAAGRAMLISAAAAQWNVSACRLRDRTALRACIAPADESSDTANWPRRPPSCLFPSVRNFTSNCVPSGATSGKRATRCSICPTSSPARLCSESTTTMPGMVYASIEHPPVLGARKSSPTTTKPRSRCRAFRRRSPSRPSHRRTCSNH